MAALLSQKVRINLPLPGKPEKGNPYRKALSSLIHGLIQGIRGVFIGLLAVRPFEFTTTDECGPQLIRRRIEHGCGVGGLKMPVAARHLGVELSGARRHTQRTRAA